MDNTVTQENTKQDLLGKSLTSDYTRRDTARKWHPSHYKYKKIGAWRGGWMLLRASWSTLKLDKELVLFPIYAALANLAWLIVVALVFGLIVSISAGGDYDQITKIMETDPPLWYQVPFLLLSLVGLYATTNYFAAGLIASAIHRFQGSDPTVNFGLGRARLRLRSILKFSVLQATLGTIFQIADEKLPLLGRISSWIVDIAWRLASLFAIPVIVMSEQELGPIEAIRKSAGIFKKTWGQNFTASLGMGVITIVAFLVWVGLAFSAGLLAVGVGSWTLWLTAPIIGTMLVLMISVVSALNGIFTAALYHFATTGQSPAEFDHNLLMATFKPNKKWFS